MPAAPQKSRSRKWGRPPRVWPGVLIVALVWLSTTLPARFSSSGMTAPGVMEGVILGALGGTLLFLIWWLGFSRVPWGDRWRGLAIVIAALAAGLLGGFHPYMRAMPVAFYLLPSILLAAVAAMVVTRPLGWRRARWPTLVASLLPIVVWCCLRSNGMSGYLAADFAWRWTPTAEQEFLANLADPDASIAKPDSPGDSSIGEPLVASDTDWPEFRGPHRDGRLVGVEVRDDWAENPPRELWRRDVGPGWSSFCVIGDNVFTQEQRGEQEMVVCYDLNSGDERWASGVEARFDESTAGAGPRGTPTFDGGFLYTTGGSGVVQKLDARTGKQLWQRSLIDDTPMEVPPEWGFASSPLIVDRADGGKLAIVYAGDPRTKSLPLESNLPEAAIAYDTQTGEPVWRGGAGFHGYGSPHLATLLGVPQVVITSNAGAESLDPQTGKSLWFYDWPIGGFPRIVQPLVRGDDTLIIATGYGAGTHAIKLNHTVSRDAQRSASSDGAPSDSAPPDSAPPDSDPSKSAPLRVAANGDLWTTETVWQSKELKPYFNDLVEHEGFLYGFDGIFLTCIDPETGESSWPKRSRREVEFGQGQVLLVADSGLLVVTTELTGEVVLLRADPTKPEVLARIPAAQGKTWNHPVIAHGKLLVRNGREMVCFDVTEAEEPNAAQVSAQQTRRAR
ncbi:Outer membrane protein assembly factor BamB [Pirellulimonas nuda]|uniref:Outer membrane protein assembly factor BamB n=1 Tax=Pirellulimonas nuda TaxID=2528009 RepID=A0A518D7J2_9BACT|nr:PQQ-binding-like beta-propeller repeat protein [Pirellulimonas nuda]QDU87419.1 Outer membrane protein assembly factor BamB [Pirellulimonas nuda]